MGKKTGLFNKILAGLLSLAIILGLASPVLANDKGDRFSYEVDMVIVVDISGSMSGTKMTKAKKSAKDMAEAIWKEQESHNISTNIALISFASDVIHHKNDGADFFRKKDKSKLFNAIDGLVAKDMTFTQGGIHEARMIFKKSTGDKKIIVLLSDGEANRIYEPKIDLDDYMNNNKKVLEGSFYYDRVGQDTTAAKGKFCALAEANLAKSDNIDVLDIYTVAVDCNEQAKEFLKDVASDKDKFKDSETDDLEDVFEDLTNEIKDKIEKEKLEKELEDLNNRIDELDKAREDLEQELAEERDQAAKDKEELNEEIDHLKDKIDELEKAKDRLEEELADEKEKSEEDKKALEKEIDDLKEETDKLNEARENLERELEDIITKTEKDKEELENNIAELDKNIEDLRREKDLVEEELNNKIKELEDRLEQERAEHEKDKEELDNKVSDLNDKIDQLDKEKEEIEDQLEKEIEGSKAERDELRDSIENLEDKIEQLARDKDLLEEDLRKELDKVNKEIEALKKAKADIEEELRNQKNQSSKDKEKLNYEINKLDDKIYKLNKEKDKLVKDNEKYREKFESLENDIRDLKESLEKEKDKNNLKDMELPEGVKVNQWYPEKLVSLPDKKTYDDGEDIDMTGMKMRFTRVIKRNGQYIRETEDVDYKDFKKVHRGWEFNLKTKTAKYDESTQGKMKIIYTFTLKYPNQSW